MGPANGKIDFITGAPNQLSLQDSIEFVMGTAYCLIIGLRSVEHIPLFFVLPTSNLTKKKQSWQFSSSLSKSPTQSKRGLQDPANQACQHVGTQQKPLWIGNSLFQMFRGFNEVHLILVRLMRSLDYQWLQLLHIIYDYYTYIYIYMRNAAHKNPYACSYTFQ